MSRCCRWHSPELWSPAGCRGQQPQTQPSRVSCTQHRVYSNPPLHTEGCAVCAAPELSIPTQHWFCLLNNTDVRFSVWFYHTACYTSQSVSTTEVVLVTLHESWINYSLAKTIFIKTPAIQKSCCDFVQVRVQEMLFSLRGTSFLKDFSLSALEVQSGERSKKGHDYEL